MIALLNIPAHTGCVNCGQCCGIIPATRQEIEVIRNYLSTRPALQRRAQAQSIRSTCPFRDGQRKRCIIYPVRPTICRLMGVAKGMQCANGNSAAIDGQLFLGGGDKDDVFVLNSLDWVLKEEKAK